MEPKYINGHKLEAYADEEGSDMRPGGWINLKVRVDDDVVLDVGGAHIQDDASAAAENARMGYSPSAGVYWPGEVHEWDIEPYRGEDLGEWEELWGAVYERPWDPEEDSGSEEEALLLDVLDDFVREAAKQAREDYREEYETVRLTIRDSSGHYEAEISPDGDFNVIQSGDKPIEDILMGVDFGKHRAVYDIAKAVLDKWSNYTDDQDDEYVTVGVERDNHYSHISN